MLQENNSYSSNDLVIKLVSVCKI